MSGSLEERLTELEVRLAFVDDTMLSLSDTIAQHDRHLHELRNAIDALRSDLLVVRGTLGDAVQDEPPPPHY